MKNSLVLPVVFGLMTPAFAGENVDNPDKPKTATTRPTEAKVDMHPRVEMETTLGKIVIELNADKAPITVENFLKYVDSKFYEGTIYHRVMPDFMIQGGGFTPDMEKKTAGLLPPIKNEAKNGLKNKRGTIAMARTRALDSATSQFFINVVDNASLDYPKNGGYAVFGRVVEGMDVVDKIRHTETREHPKLPMGKVVPVEPIVIQSVRRLEAAKPPAKKPKEEKAAGEEAGG